MGVFLKCVPGWDELRRVTIRVVYQVTNFTPDVSKPSFCFVKTCFLFSFILCCRSKRSKMADTEGFWDCSVCTFKNPPEAFKCDMCDVRKGTSTRLVLHTARNRIIYTVTGMHTEPNFATSAQDITCTCCPTPLIYDWAISVFELNIVSDKM